MGVLGRCRDLLLIEGGCGGARLVSGLAEELSQLHLGLGVAAVRVGGEAVAVEVDQRGDTLLLLLHGRRLQVQRRAAVTGRRRHLSSVHLRGRLLELGGHLLLALAVVTVVLLVPRSCRAGYDTGRRRLECCSPAASRRRIVHLAA